MELKTRPNSLLCISGGADSMYLLHFYKNEKNIHVAHVNYNIREDSGEDETLVESYCKQHSIPFHCLRTKPIKETGVEEWARDVRYAFFNELKEKYNLKYTVTAHNSNDQAETVLMRLYRGTGFGGLAGIYKDSCGLYRPMLAISKKEIYDVCHKLDIPYREDSTNTDTKYLRNWFRKNYVTDELLSPLCKIAESTQDLKPRLLKLAEFMFADTIKTEENKIIIAKQVDNDALCFLYLTKLFGERYKMTEHMFEMIFSTDSSLNKFTTANFVCDKRKKKTITITFN